jgi:Glyoxalase/Bleomycin resistance protein/Dioxygenase superfamily
LRHQRFEEAPVITAMPRIAIAMHDFGAAVSTFRDVFGMPVVDFSEQTVPALGAHVGMCVPEGGSNIELMSPADPDKPLSQALQRFLDRRGDGLYALMLEAPDPDVEAAALSQRGLDVLPLMAGASGRDVHPRSTHGVLIRVYPNNSAQTRGPHESLAPGFSGITKVIVATADAALAAIVYGRGFGLDVGAVIHDEKRGVLCAQCRAPKGGVIELVSAVDNDKPFAQDIERCVKEDNGGMYALVLQAPDPRAAVAVLNDRGVTTGVTDPEAVVFGTRFFFE